MNDLVKPSESGLSGQLQEAVAQLMHEMSQPITALRCCLDVALLRQQSAEEYREIITQAIMQVERLAGYTLTLREIAASQPDSEARAAANFSHF